MEWTRIISACLGLIISVPVFWLRLVVRLVRAGKGVWHLQPRPAPPPALLDPALGTHRYTTTKAGLKIHYVEAGQPDRPLMLFLHGWPQFWYAWRYQLRHFQQDYRVVAMDMRGFGDSDKPAGISNYFIQNLADDVVEVADSLGAEQFTLVAHDWGGMVAWTVAALHPARLSSLVCCNIPHPVPFMEARRGSWEQALKSWYILYFQCPIFPELGMLMEDIKCFDKFFEDNPNNDAEVKEAYRYAFRDYTAWNRTINYYRATTLQATEQFFKENQSKFRIKVPTLQIFGEADRAIAASTARASAAWVQDHRLELLAGVSHWVQEQAPDKVNSLIKNFIENIPSSY